MGSLLVVSFVILVGPLSYFFGADSRRFDSRRVDDRGWLASRR